MSKLIRPLAVATGLVATCAVIVFTAGAVGAKPKKKGKPDSGTIHAATTYSVGSTNYAAGNVKDKLFGNIAVTYVIKLAAVSPGTIKLTAKPVTTWGKAGTLSGTATATLTVASNGSATITNGKLNENKGTGKWKGHKFVATFTGTGSVTTGRYVFTYKGTFK